MESRRSEPWTPVQQPRLSPLRALGSRLLPVLLLSLAAPAAAQEEAADIPVASDDDARAAAEAEMRELDAMVATIEGSLDIFLARKERREILEGVVLKGDRAEVWVLRPLKLNIEAAKCDAYRWLLLGRLKQSKGVQPIFARYPHLEEITLVFYEIASQLEHDGRGGYIQERSAIRHVELTLSRGRAAQLDPKALAKALGGDRAACIRSGESAVDHHWYIK